ncbi:NUDIX hydrolase [Marivivens marinus]|uniref:NUDIX hydrolase n=1 Tax=Marivivens marinus TaxID=3110173 RepID=UPI003B849C3C
MTLPSQLPLKLRAGRKTDVRTQFAALPFRVVGDKVQICLITSRGTGRWILPKGWPMHKETPAQAAATEAWEEAGIVGDPIDRCLGVYSYVKSVGKSDAPIVTLVYPVSVRKLKSDWPERGERKRKWFSRKKAAQKVAEPALRAIIDGFDPKQALR